MLFVGIDATAPARQAWCVNLYIRASAQVDRPALLIYQPSTTPGRQVGRSALLFSSASLLLHMVGRSAGWQVGTSLLRIWLPSFRSGWHVGKLALLICQPSSTYCRQVGRLALFFSSASLFLHLVGSVVRRFDGPKVRLSRRLDAAYIVYLTVFHDRYYHDYTNN